MFLISNEEMKQLEEVRKSIHKYIGNDLKKFQTFESLTGAIYRITHRRRDIKYIVKQFLNKG